MSLFLGVDLGTSGVKSVLLRSDGEIASIGYRPYGIDIPKPGYAEQSPEMWWRALCEATAEALNKASAPRDSIRCIGFSGQMHGTVLIGADGEPLSPAIIWCDQRSIAESRHIRETIGAEALGRWTQNPVAPGFQITSLLWMRANRPDIFERIRYVLLPKDYLRYRMTGEIGSDVTDASSTLLFDCAGADWSREMLDAFSIDRGILPDASHMPWEVAGELTARAATELGLEPGIPVVYGGGDQPMQAIGNGILAPGDASITIGTGGQILLPTDTPLYDPELRTHTFCHVERNRWYVMGATLNACLSQNWFMGQILESRDYEGMDREIEAVRPGCDGLVFLPYLTGERTPHMDPKARGVFFGLTLNHGRAAMARALLEGVAFSLMDAMEVIVKLRLPLNRLIISGGGAKSTVWRQIIADVFDRPIYTARMREEAGVGAAICAMVGAGEYASLEAACARIVRYEEMPVTPVAENVAAYERQYKLFREIYRVNAKLFQAL